MSSRRNGGEGQEVRKETLTGGEELLERAGEVSRDRTRPARAKTEVVLILVRVRVEVCKSHVNAWTRGRVTGAYCKLNRSHLTRSTRALARLSIDLNIHLNVDAFLDLG
jgi:hypothetical protein